MIRWVQLGTASVPGGNDGLRLMQRGTEFTIFAGANELMGNRLIGSEEALASLTCARLAGRRAPRVLIGGLGMGFTLRATLAALGTDARVSVVELIPEVIAWARGPLAAIHGDSLADPRLTLIEGDVGEVIGGASSSWDAIVLDVDNGPEGLMRAANDELYDAYGLLEAQKALAPGGVLAVWSAAPHEAFAQRLRRVGYAVEEHRVHANARKRGPRHVVWLATKSG